ncbi:LysR family transcriptional regulator [Legionella spiritensis]|uniref:LysR family transporter transcriptional regulator n=1 Tax=Legionella spiritensis TaxID=452 RepID=A0A0W0Z407_LEGSP|nr:LysR family transcriptional regulator [Legionella spiritensis]KTD63860.1 LysR family transporter transcriptional regulator [Legionella spiritensis]SNV35505.1 transcriptional regulator [Legionella spiritensis]
MDINTLNLNLLRALSALIRARNVTIAAKTVGVSQSSMSGFLKQLREVFDDELLVPGQYKIMQLTPLASSLADDVHSIMSKIDQVFNQQDSFHPASSQRIFRIGMTDLISALLLQPLMKRLSSDAPNVQIKIIHPRYLDSLEYFEQHQMDLVVGFFENVPQNLKRQLLFKDNAVIACCKNHPACSAPDWNIDELIKYPLIQFSLTGTPFENYMKKYLSRLRLNKPVSINVGTGLTPFLSLSGTTYLTLTIKRLVDRFENSAGITALKVPFEYDCFVCHQYWHPRHDNDPGHSWLRKTMKNISETLDSLSF